MHVNVEATGGGIGWHRVRVARKERHDEEGEEDEGSSAVHTRATGSDA
jgi:hypothetical protein